MYSQIDQITELKSIRKRTPHRQVPTNSFDPTSSKRSKIRSSHKIIICIILAAGVASICFSWINIYGYETNLLSASEDQIQRQTKLLFSPSLTHRWDGIDAFHRLAQSRAANLYPFDKRLAFQPTNICERKIAIFLQVDHNHLWNDMLSCVANVATAAALKGCEEIDIFISIYKGSQGVNQEKIDQFQSDLLNISHVHKVNFQNEDHLESNMSSFVRMLSQMSNIQKTHDIILKMHTEVDQELRAHGLESLCGTPEHVISIFDHFSKAPKLDMIVPQGTVFGPKTKLSEIFPLIVDKLHLHRSPLSAFDKSTQKILKYIHKELFSNKLNEKAEKDNEITLDDMVTVEGAMFWLRYSTSDELGIINKLPVIEEKLSKYGNQSKILQRIWERIVPTEIISRKRWIAEIPPAPRIVAIYSPQIFSISADHDVNGWKLEENRNKGNEVEPFDKSLDGLKFSDLMSMNARKKLAKTVKQFGVNALLFQHYWFIDQKIHQKYKILHQVAEQMLLDNEPDLPFAFAWYNEPILGPKSSSLEEIVFSEEYGNEDDWKDHFNYLLPFFQHQNYIRIFDKPVFILHSMLNLESKLKPMISLWQKLAKDVGLQGIHFIKTINNSENDSDKSEWWKGAHIDAAFHLWPRLLDNGVDSTYFGSTEDIAPITGMFPAEYWGSFIRQENQPKFTNEWRNGLSCSFLGMSQNKIRNVHKNLYFVDTWNGWNEQTILEDDNISKFEFLQILQKKLAQMPLSIIFPLEAKVEDFQKQSQILEKCKSRCIDEGCEQREEKIQKDSNDVLKVSLVMSYCNNDMSWFEDFINGVPLQNLTVVSKCNGAHEIPVGGQLMLLNNVGRNDHTYARYMSEILPSKSPEDDEVIVFSKDNLNSYHTSLLQFGTRTFQDLVETAWREDFSCYLTPMVKYHLTNLVTRFNITSYDGHGDLKNINYEFKSKYRNLKDWLVDLSLELPSPLTEVCYGGIFAVKKSRILSMSKNTFEKIEKSLSRGDNIEEGHFIERSWAGLLAKPLSEKEINEIMQHPHAMEILHALEVV